VREAVMAQRDDNSAALVDAIYEAPFIPERWPALLQALSRATDGEGGLLLTVDGKHTLNWTACSFVTPLMERFIEGGYEKYNIRPQRGLAKRYPGFMTDQDVMTDEEIEASPIHRDILRPAGIGWSAGTVIPTPSGDLIVFDLSRHIDRGSYDRATLDLLDGFRPHLARAGLLAARMHLEQARSATDMMAKLGLPSAAVDAWWSRTICSKLCRDRSTSRRATRSSFSTSAPMRCSAKVWNVRLQAQAPFPPSRCRQVRKALPRSCIYCRSAGKLTICSPERPPCSS
jgi:hypothetical protein